MKAVFVELPAFERNRANYLNDDEFKEFQERLLKNPEAGDMIEGTGVCAKFATAIPAEVKAPEAAYVSFTTGGAVAHSSGFLRSTIKTSWKT